MSVIEIWKDVSGYEGLYQVSDLGRIKSYPFHQFNTPNGKYSYYKAKILSQSLTEDGYLKITFSKGTKETFLVHRLVAIAFIPNPENKPEVNHKKGVKIDNRAIELEWSTSSENQFHSYSIGLKESVKGELNGFSKLKESEIIEIRKIGKSMLKKDIAKKYNVGSSTISRILNNESWKHLI